MYILVDRKHDVLFNQKLSYLIQYITVVKSKANVRNTIIMNHLWYEQTLFFVQDNAFHFLLKGTALLSSCIIRYLCLPHTIFKEIWESERQT